MKQTFEEFLMDKCPSNAHTNNSPEGFEKWEEQLDIQELEDYAEEFGYKCYLEGREKNISVLDIEVIIAKKLPYDGECSEDLKELLI